MESYDSILKRMEDAYEEKSGCRPEAVSDIGLRLRVLAGEIYRAQEQVAWLKRQAFPQTAEGEYLDRHAQLVLGAAAPRRAGAGRPFGGCAGTIRVARVGGQRGSRIYQHYVHPGDGHPVCKQPHPLYWRGRPGRGWPLPG